MTVSSLLNNSSTSSSASSGTSITGNAASEASDMFTKLLVAQIQNQDPTNPTDPQDFVQQLTQLSQTESLQNLTTVTSNSASVLQSMQVLALGAQVGSNVMAETTSVTLDGSTVVSGQTTLASSSTATKVVLTGTDGTEYTVNLGSQAPGTVAFSIDPATLGIPAGSYTIAVSTSSGETPATDIQGRLNSVKLATDGSVTLNVANIGQVATTAITAFNGATSTASASATQSSL
ncbi:flagellar basal body rod modification protein [Duganella sp. FT80W]|uniref:Basal-body rod modification protein FlgD n=1 Tax=Duganella guangzhouensis TaxID=2666084 RepID=A0A6I2L2D2_9BURK|nr:flagellar hook capping FlgD N-terminal domain-containing protein [Duganella guangzhouensis]MRW90736.1 flagellar basal body rod modification protein [Duganella guangzhouensis]